MIYLIGGPPRCGKTTLARQLAKRLCISYLSVDSLESVIYHYLSPEERAMSLPLLPGGYDTTYATRAIIDIIQIYRIRARALWPALQVLIHFALAQEQDLILEGFQIEPQLLNEFTPVGQRLEDYPHTLSVYQHAMLQAGTGYAVAHANDERITAVFLYKQDVDAIATGITQATAPDDWVLRQTRDEITIRRMATMVSEYGHAIHTEADHYHLPSFNMDQNFFDQIEQITTMLMTKGRRTAGDSDFSARPSGAE